MKPPAFRTLSGTKPENRRCVGEWSFDGAVTRVRFRSFSEAWKTNALVQSAFAQGKSVGKSEACLKMEDSLLEILEQKA